MTDTGTLNLRWSHQLIAGFAAAGIRDAVISPGSRSTPLAIALLRQPGIACHVVIDERCAAFFALGLAKASGRPTLVLATSGSAPANWYPAVVEASQAGVPLVLISADRPPELQARGANQTIDQSQLFANHVRARHLLGAPDEAVPPANLQGLAAQATEQALWPHPGPVHLNQPFREPLFVADLSFDSQLPHIACSAPSWSPAAIDLGELPGRIAGRQGVIVCGEMPARPGQSEAVAALAAHLDCPILAEPLSGLRYGPHDRSRVCTRYGRWLGTADLPQPEWIIRFGAYPVTRALQQFVAQDVTTHALVEPWPRWIDPAHRLTHVLRGEPASVCAALQGKLPAAGPSTWPTRFTDLEHDEVLDDSESLATAIIAELPPETALFIGNSLAIRQLDRDAAGGERPLAIYANRGASGIDGNISTAAGIARHAERCLALIGDLTAQHDLGGLALAQGCDLVVVVINNGGGGIFDLLPQRDLPEFERGWRTPQHIDFEHAALTFGLGYRQADTTPTLRRALRAAFAAGGPWLLELRVAQGSTAASR